MPDSRNLVLRIIFTYFGLPNGLGALTVVLVVMVVFSVYNFLGQFIGRLLKKLLCKTNLY